jgi:hypothetical protein
MNHDAKQVTQRDAERVADRAATVGEKLLRAKTECSALRRRIRNIRLLTTYLRLARSLRKVADKTLLRPGVVLVGATLLWGLAVVVGVPLIWSFLPFFAAGAGMAVALYVPRDSKIAELIAALPTESIERIAALENVQSIVSTLEIERRELGDMLRGYNEALEQAAIRESRRFRLQALLQMNWKALRSREFEQFLELVFRELGYVVETTRVTGDQGVDLIVAFKGRRIAIQVKGYFNSVSNSAVQEAYAGKGYYNCHGCAVITNSRFTSSARDLAAKVGCVLIDELLLPKLVLGHIDLAGLCFHDFADMG